MKRILSVILIAACAGCGRREQPTADWDTVTMVSLLSDFRQGAYAGKVAFSNLLEHGRLGIGAMDGLDGEMMIMNGRVYRFAADGQASLVSVTNTTPSATVTFFDSDIKFDVGQLDDTIFKKTMDWKRPPGAEIVAFRVTGLFDVVKTRSVPRQSPPFRPLAEIAGSTVESEWRDTAGTMIGFYFPDSMKDVNWPGYHLHFIDKDRMHGGHVLSFKLRQGRIEMDPCLSAYSMLGTNGVVR